MHNLPDDYQTWENQRNIVSDNSRETNAGPQDFPFIQIQCGPTEAKKRKQCDSTFLNQQAAKNKKIEE